MVYLIYLGGKKRKRIFFYLQNNCLRFILYWVKIMASFLNSKSYYVGSRCEKSLDYNHRRLLSKRLKMIFQYACCVIFF